MVCYRFLRSLRTPLGLVTGYNVGLGGIIGVMARLRSITVGPWWVQARLRSITVGPWWVKARLRHAVVDVPSVGSKTDKL